MAEHFQRQGSMVADLEAQITANAEKSELLELAMIGDMLFNVTPATVASESSASGGWTRDVVITLTNGGARDVVHTWFSKAIASAVAIADDSTDGEATIVSTTLTFVNGTCTVTITGDDADWADAETNTLTVAEATILGYTIAAQTSVETFSDA